MLKGAADHYRHAFEYIADAGVHHLHLEAGSPEPFHNLAMLRIVEKVEDRHGGNLSHILHLSQIHDAGIHQSLHIAEIAGQLLGPHLSHITYA